MGQETKSDLRELTVDLVAAFVSNNVIGKDDLPGLIASTHAALAALGAPASDVGPAASAVEFPPAVSARRSLANHEHILSMIDGKPYRALKRHLTANGLTPATYRARYNLPASYPMVAPAYSQQRSEMAKKRGLGRKTVVTGRKPRRG